VRAVAAPGSGPGVEASKELRLWRFGEFGDLGTDWGVSDRWGKRLTGLVHWSEPSIWLDSVHHGMRLTGGSIMVKQWSNQ